MDVQDIIDRVAKVTPEWLAGFFDGEGCVSSQIINNKRGRISVTITQKEPSIILAISMKYPGGTICKREKTLKNNKGFTTHWQLTYWDLCGLNFLKSIQPFVIQKLPQVNLALEFMKLVTYVGGNLSDETKSARLNLVQQITKINRDNMAYEPLEGEKIQ